MPFPIDISSNDKLVPSHPPGLTLEHLLSPTETTPAQSNAFTYSSKVIFFPLAAPASILMPPLPPNPPRPRRRRTARPSKAKRRKAMRRKRKMMTGKMNFE